MKRYHPRSWLQAISPSAPCEHMAASSVGAYVETLEAEKRIAELENSRDEFHCAVSAAHATIEKLERERDEARDLAAIFKRTLDKRERERDEARALIRRLIEDSRRAPVWSVQWAKSCLKDARELVG